MKTTQPPFLSDSLGKPGTGWCGAAAEGLCWGESWWHSQEWVCSDFCLGGLAWGWSDSKAPPAGYRGEVPLLQYGARPHALDGWSQPADWRAWQPQVNVIFCFISSITIIIAVIISASSIFKSYPLSSFVTGMFLRQGWSLPIIRTSSQRLRPGQTALLPVLKWEILSSTIIIMQLMRYWLIAQFHCI